MLSRKLALAASVGLAALALASCSPTVNTRGNLVEDQRLAEIQPGVSTKDTVAAVLGTPSSVASFDENTWYYIGQRTETRAFFKPEIVERRVVEVSFNDQGLVETVQDVGLDAAQDVELVERETPTLGRQITFLEQMLGNFGRGLGRVEGRQAGAPRVPGQ